MNDITIVWKLAGALWFLLTLGLGWWITDLKDKHKRNETRIDEALVKLSNQRDRITRLESDSITEVEVVRMMNDMERRIMDNFKDFRLEFKEDFKSFAEDLKRDLNR